LIGDDEHGWSENGVFNFEDGCYAKVIRLSPEAEPQIHACTRRFGTILENVVIDPLSHRLDLNDDALTENTRGAYPLDYIGNYLPPKMAGHPRNVIFLTCDASGVMPPIGRLTADQAIYHFISGYTSKIAGTEIGLGVEPEVTFSACFGGPFMVHHPYVYARMLKARLMKHGVTCWIVNTGWTGGPFGVGKRISIRHTRALLDAALSGKLEDVSFRQDPVFGFAVPTECEGVPAQILDPASSWSNREAYWRQYGALAVRFIENFKLLQDGCPDSLSDAGPQLQTLTALHAEA
jgi:phosphoenolpyruvate carboxykinase (ATP)